MPDVTDRPRGQVTATAAGPDAVPGAALASCSAALLGALLVAAAAMLALPAALRQLIDHGLASANRAGASIATSPGFLVAAALFGVFAALRFYLVTWLGERVVADLREAVYRRVVRMDPTFFEVTRTGEVLSRLTADTTLVQAIAGVNLSITLRSALNLVGGGDAAGAHQRPPHDRGSWSLMPIVIVPMIVIRAPGTAPVARHPGPDRRHQQPGGRDAQRHPDRAGLHARGAAEPALCRGGRAQLRGRHPPHARARGTHRDRHHAGVRGITYVLWLGAHAVLVHAMTWGQLSQFFIYAAIVGTAAASLIEMWGEMQRAAGAMERLSELLRRSPRFRRRRSPLLLPARVRGRYRLRARQLSISVAARHPGARRLHAGGAPWRNGRGGRTLGRRQEHQLSAAAALLRSAERAASRIDGHDISAFASGGIAPADRLRAAGHGAVRRQRAREYRLWPPGSRRCRDRGGGARGCGR